MSVIISEITTGRMIVLSLSMNYKVEVITKSSNVLLNLYVRVDRKRLKFLYPLAQVCASIHVSVCLLA